ncbi:MAG: hypothetical protein HFI09_04480 [Bacilli bacterium]|nr:hypothetical protein [Bacilli bacterium]
MQNKKGLYLLLAFIGTILLFFCILFFVHERTLENGILFTVSFHYENAQDITYNFYNQSGKIEKVEIGEDYKNSFLLEKTDYKSVKLLRKLLKGLKEKKEKPTEEGITIYNAQNKRYYLLPFTNETAQELSNLIIDGYIHAEMKRLGNQEQKSELYLYENDDTLAWTKNGHTKRIVHTYKCINEDCEGIYSDQDNNEKIIKDGDYFIYNDVTKSKEKINIDTEITDVKLLKWENQILGLQLTKNQTEKAFYDVTKESVITPFENTDFSLINNELILETKKLEKNDQEENQLKVWNRLTKEELWYQDIVMERNSFYQIKELKNDHIKFFLLEKTLNGKTTYQILDSKWQSFLDNRTFNQVELNEEDLLIVKTQKENQILVEQYDINGVLVPLTDANQKNE